MWEACVKYGIPLVYASSAATYGGGEHGYSDQDDSLSYVLKPLNPYGDSKNDFDKWALAQERKPYFWAGLKFFNVYGPNEYHKGRMASVVFHAFNQINATGEMKLFRSHHPDYKDGEQLRDFVYVKDVCSICLFLMEHRKHSGLYNLGSGEARTFLDLVRATFTAMGKEEHIAFVDTPADIRDKYQYFTEADMSQDEGHWLFCAIHHLGRRRGRLCGQLPHFGRSSVIASAGSVGTANANSCERIRRRR
jgi:ADP-L-glycero-D-manno-heptose 6-epimerase